MSFADEIWRLQMVQYVTIKQTKSTTGRRGDKTELNKIPFLLSEHI